MSFVVRRFLRRLFISKEKRRDNKKANKNKKLKTTKYNDKNSNGSSSSKLFTNK